MVTVSGVAFTPSVPGVAVGRAGTETITLNNADPANNPATTPGAFGDGEFGFNGPIFNLLRGGSFQVLSVDLGGLEIDQEYLIQVITHDARTSRNTNTIVGFGDGSGSGSPVGFSSVSNLDPEFVIVPGVATPNVTGHSIIGTFTADAASLNFEVFGTAGGPEGTFTSGIGQAQINAIQLRRVEEVIVDDVGDFNGDGLVDCDDLDGYVGNLGEPAVGDLAALDIDGDGTLSLDDAEMHITTLVVTSNGVTGTILGDLNCDGSVSVLGDAILLIGSLGEPFVTTYAEGDVTFDGTVTVLGDALVLVGALGFSNIQ